MLGLTYWRPPKLPELPTVFTEPEVRHRAYHFLTVKLQGVFPTVAFTEAELRRLPTPTLLLLGGQDRAMDERAAGARARRLLPHLEVEMIPNAGHIVSMEQPEVVNARILRFLGEGQNPQTARGTAASSVALGKLALGQNA